MSARQETVTIRMPQETEWLVDCLASVHLVRQDLSETLVDHPVQLAHNIELCASELVTNALTHGKPPVRVRLRIEPPTIRLEVHDCEVDLHPRLRSPGPAGGFGLRIVNSVAADWGYCLEPDGKTVWADFHHLANGPSPGPGQAGQISPT